MESKVTFEGLSPDQQQVLDQVKAEYQTALAEQNEQYVVQLYEYRFVVAATSAGRLLVREEDKLAVLADTPYENKSKAEQSILVLESLRLVCLPRDVANTPENVLAAFADNSMSFMEKVSLRRLTTRRRVA